MFLSRKIPQSIFSANHKHVIEWVHSKHYCNVLTEIIEKRNYVFSREQKRQLEEVGRVEKINVDVSGPPEDVTLIMNAEISTPYDCCKHISQGLCQQSPLALVDNKYLWDMHRPLLGNCSLKFLKFRDRDPHNLNKVFWRTGSFILGAVISRAFKDTMTVHLHSFPPPMLRSGSFVYDVFMNINEWIPTADELRLLSAEFLSFILQNHRIERLRVSKEIAAEIFEDNPFKSAQLKEICASSEDHLITLYRVSDHIDISTGPMVADTSFFGRASVTAVHIINSSAGSLYRFQGIALPKGILLNSYAYEIIHKRGKQLNEADYPGWSTNPLSKILKKTNQPNNSLTNVPKYPGEYTLP